MQVVIFTFLFIIIVNKWIGEWWTLEPIRTR
jgi:hypothetical protein